MSILTMNFTVVIESRDGSKARCVVSGAPPPEAPEVVLPGTGEKLHAVSVAPFWHPRWSELGPSCRRRRRKGGEGANYLKKFTARRDVSVPSIDGKAAQLRLGIHVLARVHPGTHSMEILAVHLEDAGPC